MVGSHIVNKGDFCLRMREKVKKVFIVFALLQASVLIAILRSIKLFSCTHVTDKDGDFLATKMKRSKR